MYCSVKVARVSDDKHTALDVCSRYPPLSILNCLYVQFTVAWRSAVTVKSREKIKIHGLCQCRASMAWQ